MVDFKRYLTHFPLYLVCEDGLITAENAIWADVDDIPCLALYTTVESANQAAEDHRHKGDLQILPLSSPAMLIDALDQVGELEYVAFDPRPGEVVSCKEKEELIRELKSLED